MSAIDYTGITLAVKAALDLNLGIQSPRPRVECERALEAPDESYVGVALVERAALDEDQALVAGRRTRQRLRFEVTAWRFAMTTPQAMRLRDSLLGDIELALTSDRTLGGTVETLWLEGGAMSKPPEPRNLGFLAAGQVILTAVATAST